MSQETPPAAAFAFSQLPSPGLIPPLDAGFRPAALAHRAFARRVEAAGGGEPLLLALERGDGAVSRFQSALLPADHPEAADNLAMSERLLKFLLWQRGAWRVHLAGPEAVFRALSAAYAPGGARAFDQHFLGDRIYQQPFTMVHCRPAEMPAEREISRPLGRHLDGCRIGFDLGASDLKVSALIDGVPVFSQEIEWHPREQNDPAYHKGHILAALKLAASRLPRLDAIGGSSAGVVINNRPMVASLFRGIPRERFGEVRELFVDIGREMGVPLEIVNDGEVAALAGAMSLGEDGILGIALGSSEAAGYVTPEGTITDYLDELAFAPVDYSPTAPVEEWSGDRGCGASYFSQQCVFRLAPAAGIAIPAGLTLAASLAFVQELLEAGHEGAQAIWQSMGIYLGYGIAHYARFYDLRHVLLLGRCTSGSGGGMLLEGAQGVLRAEFPELAATSLHLPDEKSRRVGQAIAAASLPLIAGPARTP
jgi:predicted NBD/HSP70 family sugar kinase